jgi:hypothetical protein
MSNAAPCPIIPNQASAELKDLLFPACELMTDPRLRQFSFSLALRHRSLALGGSSIVPTTKLIRTPFGAHC